LNGIDIICAVKIDFLDGTIKGNGDSINNMKIIYYIFSYIITLILINLKYIYECMVTYLFPTGCDGDTNRLNALALGDREWLIMFIV